MPKRILSIFSSKNLTYILTILEAIEKISYYSKDFKDEEEFYFANKQLEMLPKIENYQAYIEEALKSKYYEDLIYLR
jgi:hypothetical protein